MTHQVLLKDLLIDFLLDSPYYGYLAAKVEFCEDLSVTTTKMRFKSSPSLHYNPEWLDNLTYDEQKGAIIHELLHLAFLHFYRRDGRDQGLWHMACDIAVSEFMDPDLLNPDIMTAQLLFIESALRLPSKKTAEDYYDYLLNIDEDIDCSYADGKVTITFNQEHVFTKDLLEEMQAGDVASYALIDQLTNIQTASFSEGVIPDHLGTHTEDVYRPHKVNWRNILKKFLTGQGRIITRKSYKRQSRRYDNLPGSKRYSGVKVLLAVDESASVSNKDVAAFHKELLRINRITSTNITAVRFDSTCSTPMPLQQFIQEASRQRRGGTDFRPVFELADQLKMPLVILFTDGEGQAPEQVKQKVLWVITNGGRVPASYGTEVTYSEE